MPIRPLSKTLQSMAEEQLNEVPSEIQEKLEHIRAWISKQPHLKCRLDDQWLLTFLRGSKFSLQKTKAKLEAYYSARSILPEFFSNRDPFAPEVAEYFKRCCIVQYSIPAEEKSSLPVVVIMRTKDYDTNQFPFDVAFKIALMIADLNMCTDDRFIVAGEHMIIDLAGWSTSILAQFTPINLKKAIHCVNVAYPNRFIGIHYLNTPATFVSVFNATKSLLPEKVINRVRMYKENELEELYKTIPRSILPIEYGGHAGSIEELSDQLHKKVQKHRDWFIEDQKYGTDEAKRTQPLKDRGMHGTEGSFRQLAVD